MAKEDIIEGLKYAIARGETLPKAMMSFYNAGYPKEEIEEAARALQVPQLPQIQTTQPKAPKITQRVSAYEEKPRAGGKTLIMVLVFFLILLLGVLLAVFLFKDELTVLLGNIL